MLITLYILILLVLLILLFTSQEQFGRLPQKNRLRLIKRSPNYKNGSFQNLNYTPSLTEGTSFYKVFKEFFFEKKERKIPVDVIPSIKTDLKSLDKNEDVLIWFGHSSYYMQLDGKRILVDPVFSGSVSPLPVGQKAFRGTDIYSTDDFPEIDYLFITHDHWDHLDYSTIKKLRSKIKLYICGLGVGEHLERWGIPPDKIIEKDWNESFSLGDFTVNTLPARHFSGRGFKRNKSLWLSFALKTPTQNIFIGGDSGYDNHFKEIGNKFGPFDLAILENGQYDIKWRYIHMLPGEILTAAKEIKAKKLFAVHSSKFSLSTHPWDEPLKKLIENNEEVNLPIITPMIGEKVRLKDSNQKFSHWWKEVN